MDVCHDSKICVLILDIARHSIASVLASIIKLLDFLSFENIAFQ